MTYSKKQWVDDEVIERSEMQNIEDGVDAAHDNIDSHTIDATKHLTSAQNDGLDGANAPGSSNVFATILDIALTIDDTAYNESTWDGDTDAASKNAIRDKIIIIDSDIALNTTHKTSDGSDHTFINQDVTSGSSPTFDGNNITAIPSDNVIFNVLGTPTYKTAQDWFNVIQTSGIISGFELSNTRLATELDVAAGTGIVKITDSEIGSSISFDFTGVQNVTLTSNNINYIYLDYNMGTPQIVTTTNRASIELNRHFIIGRVYKCDSTLCVLNAGVHLPNMARNEHERLVERDGFTYSSGAIASETGTLNLAITAGVWFLGHNRLTTDALDSSVADTWIYTHYGAASWITDNATATAVDTTHYNDGTDVLASLGSNNYGAQWIYISTDSHWYIIYDTINGTLSDAQATIPPTSIPSYLEHMGELIAKIIYKQDGTIVSIEITRDVEFTASGIPNHNDTGGIQGGTANEYYHLTSAEKTLFDTVETNAAADQTASEVPIVDSGSIITATDVEDALQENRTAINLNTAKDTNATHTGDVTGSEELIIGAAKVTEVMQVLADNVTNDVSTSKHGYVPKLSNVVTEFLNGQGGFTTPAGESLIVNIYLSAEAAYLPATNPAALTEVAGATTYAGWSYLSFDDSTAETAIWRVPMPDYDEGNIVVNAYIKPATTPDGTPDPVTVAFDMLTLGVASGETWDTAVLTDAANGSSAIDMSIALSTGNASTEMVVGSVIIDPDNVNVDEILLIGLKRNPTAEDVINDHLEGDVQLLGITIEYTRA